jgi:hypothetical protein
VIKGVLIPAGTVTMFVQGVTPDGWTRTQVCNDHAARITVVVDGGSFVDGNPISSSISLAHVAHGFADSVDHTHAINAHLHNFVEQGVTTYAADGAYFGVDGEYIKQRGVGGSSVACVKASTDNNASGSTDGDGAHAHVGDGSPALSDVGLAYVSAITASKDAYNFDDYVDMTTFFADDNLLAWQDLETLTQNDHGLKQKMVPSESMMMFYQSAAPVTWTKISTYDDRLVRIVSTSAGGATGGSVPISTGITLSHAHAIESMAHAHTIAIDSHTHNIATGNASAGSVSENYLATNISPYSTDAVVGAPGGYSTNRKLKNTFSTASGSLSTNSDSHNHGGNTGVGLSDITLAYADVIACSKD